jgi:hypothetical protein
MNEQGFLTEIKGFFNWVANSLDLLIDKPITFLIRLLKKSFSILIVILGLFFLDTFFRWTDHFEEDRKLDRIQKINALLEKKDLQINVKQSLTTLQNQVLAERNYKIYVKDFFQGLSFLPHNISFTCLTQSMNNRVNKIGSNILNFDWGHFITSSFMIILFLFFSTKQLITGKNLDNRLRPVGYVITLLLIGLAITFSNTTQFLNPFNGWFWHSVFNILFHVLSIFLIIASAQITNNEVNNISEFWQKLRKKY